MHARVVAGRVGSDDDDIGAAAASASAAGARGEARGTMQALPVGKVI